MASIAQDIPGNHAVRAAVHRHGHLSRQGLLERAFTFAFRGLVYPQIWEDPDADMAALAITPDCHVAAIASGGCNILSYLTADPRAITAVDLNPAHIALNTLKRVAATRLGQADFHRLFAAADSRSNVAVYRRDLRAHLDPQTRRYWDRRIGAFARGFYRGGLLGRFIGTAHLLARLHGVDPRIMLTATSRAEQRRIFDTSIAPLFDAPVIRWLARQPAALFGLGIPPAQYGELSGDRQMIDVLRSRCERLACDFDIEDNYFAWQAFGRGYGKHAAAPLPPYLQPAHHASVTARAARVDIQHVNFTDYLASRPDSSLDRYVLLDAQDWMTDAQLTALWSEITRTAKPGARILYRTAGEPDIVPGRVPAAILSRWRYQAEELQQLGARDRSAVYGATHLYLLGEAA
ncbi:DUF3419 family protein [Sphingomonas sp. R86521]|uniref:DUF3419 family protein n=1 Tax=Sphingomonas sp. R86521 TaxID=3093860 RepID=UPI0036D255C6